MSFLSADFILWMAGVVMGHFLLPRRYQMGFVVLATLAFLLVYSPWSALILLGLSIPTYFFMGHWRNKAVVVLQLVLFITLIFISYKYLLQTSKGVPSREWLLLGASFYILRIIHYIIESYKGGLPQHSFGDYLTYMLFLPVLVTGPINRFDEFLREQRRKRWDSRLFATGLERILYGYVKIVLLAGYLVGIRMELYIDSLAPGAVWLRSYLLCLQYGMDLYCKFSGYSDIAIGFALLLGIRVSENFHYPFLQPNISRFWKSWHISLSSWCRDYVYMPITACYRRPYLGIIGSMLILGLWHELSARYVAWGVYHGLGIVGWQYFQRIKPVWLNSLTGMSAGLIKVVAVFITFNFVVLSFAITMSDDLSSALAIYHNLLSPWGG